MKTAHLDKCDANICQEDFAGYNWYPDESICRKQPYTQWQIKQRKLQAFYNAGLLKQGLDYYFTVPILARIGRITKSTRGASSTVPVWRADPPYNEGKGVALTSKR